MIFVAGKVHILCVGASKEMSVTFPYRVEKRRTVCVDVVSRCQLATKNTLLYGTPASCIHTDKVL